MPTEIVFNFADLETLITAVVTALAVLWGVEQCIRLINRS